MAANVAECFAAPALTVLLGDQIFEITGRTLFVGLLGLAEAVPGVTLVRSLTGSERALLDARPRCRPSGSALRFGAGRE